MESNPEHTLWRNDESLQSLEHRLARQPRTIEVVSFDFFDTLVNRLCAEPADLFVEVGRRLAAGGLLCRPLSPLEFRHARVAADERARKQARREGRPVEVGLADIYASFGQVVKDPGAAMAVELEVERALCYLNPSTASLVKYVRSQGYKTAVISDTYFTAEQLRRFLRDNAFDPGLFDAVLVSCESGCVKWDGGLYRKAFARFGIHANELLHIGDNLHADIHAAAQLGVEPVHYYRTNTHHDEIFECERRLRGGTETPAAAFNSLRVLATRLSSSADDSYRDGAFVFGPVLTRFADWCVERFAAAGVDTVLALMREGELLGELLQRAAGFAEVNLKVIPCFVSRKSTACAALEKVTVEDLDELLRCHFALTLESILEILGIAEEAAPEIPQDTLLKKIEPPQTVHDVNQFLVRSSKIKTLIETRCAQNHRLAFDYLASLIEDRTRIGILDLGWSGTIQRNIAKILRKGGRNVHTVGCYLATRAQAASLFLEGNETHAYIDTNWSRITILPEVAITSCIGSTENYARTAGGRVVPVLGAYQMEPSEVRQKERIRDGVYAFQELWLHYRRCRARDGVSSALLADLDAQTASILPRLIEYPTKPEADRLGNLHHDENLWGTDYSRQLCDRAADAQLERQGVWQLFTDPSCYWHQGTIARRSPRIVSSISRGWSHPAALGRIGAQASLEGQPSSVTGEELTCLLELLRVWNPQQVVYCASEASGAESICNLLITLASTNPETASFYETKRGGCGLLAEQPPLAESHWTQSHELIPRLIVAGPVNQDATLVRHDSRVACVAGDPAVLETLSRVRALLQPCLRVALVLTDSLPLPAIQGILSYLTPHLGPEGIITSNHGNFDCAHLAAEQPLTQLLIAWHKEYGADLGYHLWHEAHRYPQANYNWTVLMRNQFREESDDFWTLTIPGLARLDASDRLLETV